jgi:hypothetical protein
VAFLRWSRNFLAAVAAPATVDSIQTTHEFIEARVRLALAPRWKHFLKAAAGFTRSKSRTDASVDGETPSDQSPSSGAKWLARSARRLERGLIFITVFTVIVSAYAMVGRYILDQKTDALKSFQGAGDALVTDVASVWKTQPSVPILQFVTKFENACPVEATSPTANTVGTRVERAADTNGSVTAPPGPGADLATIEAAEKLVRDCREFRRERYHLIAEDIRLRSWASIFIGGWNGWPPGEVISSIAGPIVGWPNRMIIRLGSGFDEPFCNGLKADYNAKQECHEVVRGIVEGTGSTSSAILGCITLYLVPALYSLIGAGAATMRYLRHRVEASTLSTTDRPRIAYNAILGFAFGAIIGLFARYMGSESTIAPAVIALLAGFNVPAVFSFLGELSNRVFGITEAARASK